MQKFKDKTGREWRIALTVGAMQRVRDAVGVNLFDTVRTKEDGALDLALYDRLVTDGVLAARCAYAASDAPGATSESDFLEAIGAAELEPLRLALLRELLDFFPAGRLVRRILDHQAAAKEQLAAAIDSITPEAIDQALNASVGSGRG